RRPREHAHQPAGRVGLGARHPGLRPAGLCLLAAQEDRMNARVLLTAAAAPALAALLLAAPRSPARPNVGTRESNARQASAAASPAPTGPAATAETGIFG